MPLQISPFNAIGQRQRQSRVLRAHARGHFVKHGIEVQVLLLGKATPPTGRYRKGCGPITQTTQTPVGGVAEPKV